MNVLHGATGTTMCEENLRLLLAYRGRLVKRALRVTIKPLILHLAAWAAERPWASQFLGHPAATAPAARV